MAPFERIVSRIAEQLLEDERLRSNLTDAEAKTVLDWGLMWLERQIAQARDEEQARRIAASAALRVRQVLETINEGTATRQKGDLSSALKRIEALLSREQGPTRAEIAAAMSSPAPAKRPSSTSASRK